MGKHLHILPQHFLLLIWRKELVPVLLESPFTIVNDHHTQVFRESIHASTHMSHIPKQMIEHLQLTGKYGRHKLRQDLIQLHDTE